MKLSELNRIVAGAHQGRDAEFAAVSIDTRTLKPGDLFVAIAGRRFDGHEFVAAARELGACAAMVERPLDVDLPQVIVADARLALGRLGAAWRKGSVARVVGVTGSNGKTTVKEMIAAILGVNDPVLWTRGNLNNDLGVPLTLLQLKPEHRYAVIEMGANHPGEIAYVAGLAKPHVAVITNAGVAHLEGFGSRENVARAKGEIIASLGPDGVAVLNADDRFVGLWREIAGSRRILSFGFGAGADLRGVSETVRIGYGEHGFETRFEYLYKGIRNGMRLRLAGLHNVANALAATAVCLALDVDQAQIAEGLARVTPVPGRMQAERAANGALLINDAYNANPSSFKAALDVLVDLPGEPWIALGAFGELGEASAELHAELGRQAKEGGVVRLFATGPNADRAVEAFGAGAVYMQEQQEMIRELQKDLREDVVVLVKGSRSQQMERVFEALRRSGQETTCC